ncbi:MAG: tRNA (guanosine(37)-N1)-methyltransferase TrmD [Candidatus Aureabacteria bacterium]|nr:tRNA (guanosine(37)-N1)-methyltransferase TrmD [Candidatus Auribacterota bacterium]
MPVPSLQIDVVALFPGMFSGYLGESILKRAQEKGLVSVRIVNLRDFARDRHRTVDDTPYGGGSGMVLKADTLAAAVESVRGPGSRVILLSPRGQVFTQDTARRMAELRHIILVCGHYEGVDERFREILVDEEISIGDYVLTNGALPALVVIDAAVRLVPGVLGDPESCRDESFAAGRLEYPQYTRPPEFRGLKIPEVLLGGNHGEIARWRRRQSLLITRRCRPDLLAPAGLSAEEMKWLKEIEEQEGKTR